MVFLQGADQGCFIGIACESPANRASWAESCLILPKIYQRVLRWPRSCLKGFEASRTILAVTEKNEGLDFLRGV